MSFSYKINHEIFRLVYQSYSTTVWCQGVSISLQMTQVNPSLRGLIGLQFGRMRCQHQAVLLNCFLMRASLAVSHHGKRGSECPRRQETRDLEGPSLVLLQPGTLTRSSWGSMGTTLIPPGRSISVT